MLVCQVSSQIHFAAVFIQLPIIFSSQINIGVPVCFILSYIGQLPYTNSSLYLWSLTNIPQDKMITHMTKYFR